MRTKLTAALFLAACLHAAYADAPAQSQQTEPPAKLSLRVAIGARGVPSFYPLPDADGKGGGASYGIRPHPSAGLPSGPPVDTVTVKFLREGGGARVAVYAHRGAGEHRENLKAVECVLVEWQECEAAQLAAYGVEPFRLSVVRRAGGELVPPRVENRTQGVEVGEIKVHAEVPSFELVLRNASGKELRAVEIEEYRGMVPKGPPPMYDWKRVAPVKPGRTLSVTLEFGWNGKATEEGHVVEPPDRVRIKSVLYGDGTYEGDARFASRAEALREGRRVWLARVLEVLRESGDAPADYAFVQGLAQRVEMLEAAAEWTAAGAFAERYGVTHGEELERLRGIFEEGMRSQRAAVLGDLHSFLRQASANPDPALAQRWLKAVREAYERMLARI